MSITASAEAHDLMTGSSFTMISRVSSWKNGVLLDADIPISSGSEDVDVSMQVPETLRLTVPKSDRGVSYVPGGDQDHPLGCWGQRLVVELGIGLRTSVEMWQRGVYYVTDAQEQGDEVQVTASGLLGLVDEAKFISPYGPAGNFSQVLRALVEPALTVDLSNAPTDRAIPSGIVWDEDRLGAMWDLLDAWGADAWVNEAGILVVQPAGDLDGTDTTFGLSDESLDEVDPYTVPVQWNPDQTRDGAANVVVVRGYDSTGADVQAIAYNLDPTSPTRYSGPFSALPVPYVVTTPLVTTQAQAQVMANTILARKVAHAAPSVAIEAIPLLTLQARDAGRITSRELQLRDQLGIVDYVSMPLTAGDGAMSLTVRIP